MSTEIGMGSIILENEEVLQRLKEERNILDTIKRRKVNWIGHIWVVTAFWNTLLKERWREGQK